MTPETILTIGRQTLEVVVLLSLVLLLPGLLVGLLVAIFQAATQINEMTLSFIPKLLVTFAVMLFAGSWIMRLLVDFTRELITNIPALIG